MHHVDATFNSTLRLKQGCFERPEGFELDCCVIQDHYFIINFSAHLAPKKNLLKILKEKLAVLKKRPLQYREQESFHKRGISEDVKVLETRKLP